MDKKKLIRSKYFLKRKKNYFKINKKFFKPLAKLIKENFGNKKINISIFYPSSYEIDVLKILDFKDLKKKKFLLPVVERKNFMYFCEWKKNEILYVGKYGIPEPVKSNKKTPDIILAPLLAYDGDKNRLGYGKGFYDQYLNKYIRLKKKILTVGIAFSFQKYHKLPINNKDFQLNYILTEKGLI